MKKFWAFVVPAFVVGLVVIYFLPWVQSFLSNIQNATVSKIIANKFVQLLIVGAVVLVGFHAAIWVAEEVGVE